MKELRLLIFMLLVRLAQVFVPKDELAIHAWLTLIPKGSGGGGE